MQYLLDTNIIVAALIQTHPHHQQAIQWFAPKYEGSIMVCAHSLAETYAVLTRLPLSPKISPELAYRLISQNIHKLGKIVSIDANNYLDLISELSLMKLKGGIIYDAIILRTALNHKADHLVTFNTKHFLGLSSKKGYVISAV
jgi:predicted nucleic acid-binding protein